MIDPMGYHTHPRVPTAPGPVGPPAGREPLLTADQERSLARAIASGDPDARDLLVRSNLGLVVTIARHFAGRGLDQDDLTGEGNLGLIRATEEFDPAFGVRFSTYAAYWIREAIQSALASTAATIRIPSYMVQLLRRWRQAESELGREMARAASFEEVARRLGLSATRREMAGKALRARDLASDFGGRRSSPGIVEVVDPGEGPAQAADRADRAHGLRERMSDRLDARERQMLELRFGLGAGEPMTLTEVGARMGMSREGARKVEARAVVKLRD